MKTDFETFRDASPKNARRLAYEILQLEVQTTIREAFKRCEFSQKEFARRLGKSEAYVSQVLSGGKNLTLKSLAKIGVALGMEFRLLSEGKPGGGE